MLDDTLGNKQWVAENAEKIKQVFPETWTHIENLSAVYIGFQLKLLGIDWRSEKEFLDCMAFFERNGLLKRDGFLIRRARLL